MAITISTTQASGLLAGIKKAIDNGEVKTWAYDTDGDFTHSAEQWNRQAWFRPSVQSGTLVLSIIPPQGRNISKEVYGIYHGRFIEMLLVHFDSKFSRVGASAMPEAADRIAA